MSQHTPTRRLLDHLIPGGLADFVQQRRESGSSWRRISLAIHDEFAVDVTFETLRSWFPDANGDNGDEEAA
jgi:hypothetical protein